ncbi:MAG: hypothetical protein PHX44_10085 [Sulfurimonas sp.]|uniref:hypothetical protein n=1 Tax=Sulfurimonas sp. TaxID=2022749 RepID=UPI002615C218|nr:hypothetical protein [Sulfurimonas sp.]MDD2653382.1 hypothetical protein [Sulfurimonas sp.]MDD3450688.1 hypothetical protein [Sulfurimonas sp.]
MDLYAKKWTVLLGSEPLTLWIKNDQVQSAKFMDKKVQLNLDTEAIKLIKDNPTKVVNGNNLLQNQNFTQNVSKMMSSKLELAIANNDKKTLSRYARSDLVPENMKDNFIHAINRPNGLRGVLTRAVNNTNKIIQTLSKRIDRFFDKVADKTANQRLDPYLSDYQLKYVNRAPPFSQKDLGEHVDPKLMQFAEEFYKQKGLKDTLNPDQLSDRIILNEFLEKAVSKGYDLKDSSVAINKVGHQTYLEGFKSYYNDYLIGEKQNFQQTIEDLQKRLHVHELKAAAKNETIEDFKTLSKSLDQSDRIDLLVKNKEYQGMDEEQKRKVEDNHIFNPEPILQRAAELQNIAEIVQSVTPIVETVIDRTPTVDFLDKTVLSKINEQWQHQQTVNRQNATPTRDFMNISAVKFNGVSKDSLDRWGETAKSHARADAGVIDAFINASLRNANELLKIGVLKEVSKDNFKFVDNFAKQSLYNNIDKTVAEIAEANQGKHVTRETYSKDEIKERVAHMSSEQSFKDMLTPSGELDSKKLYDYAQKLQSVAAALHEQESPSKAVTRDELQRANQGAQKSQGVENVRG